jgi:hypothetical protein
VRDSGEPVLVCCSSSSWSKQSQDIPPRTRSVITAASPTTPSVTTIPARTHSTGVTCGNAGKEVATATPQYVSIQFHKTHVPYRSIFLFCIIINCKGDLWYSPNHEDPSHLISRCLASLLWTRLYLKSIWSQRASVSVPLCRIDWNIKPQ